MTTGLVLQYAIITLLVAISVLQMVRKLAPRTSARWQAAAAATLLRPGRGSFAHRIGRALQPRGATGHCGDGCGTCGSCGPSSLGDESVSAEHSIAFHRPRK